MYHEEAQPKRTDVALSTQELVLLYQALRLIIRSDIRIPEGVDVLDLGNRLMAAKHLLGE